MPKQQPMDTLGRAYRQVSGRAHPAADPRNRRSGELQGGVKPAKWCTTNSKLGGRQLLGPKGGSSNRERLTAGLGIGEVVASPLFTSYEPGERCELPQWGTGEAPAVKSFVASCVPSTVHQRYTGQTDERTDNVRWHNPPAHATHGASNDRTNANFKTCGPFRMRGAIDMVINPARLSLAAILEVTRKSARAVSANVAITPATKFP